MGATESAPPSQSASQAHGFQFPGDFEITVMGAASAALATRVPSLLEGEGLRVLHESIRQRDSREGRFVALTVSFHCQTRQDYQKAHEVLRNDPDIHYTL